MRRWWVRWAAGAAAGALVTSMASTSGPSSASMAEERATPGSAGIGDPYFPSDGNGGIDVLHYDVHDTYGFGSGRLRGWTRLRVRALQDLSRFNLDFLLRVKEVRVDRKQADFDRPSRHELRITPRSTLAAGTEFTVRVRYAGYPARVRWRGNSNWLADSREVVTMNQPHMAPWWFPANDHPRDKAPFDIHITTRRQSKVIANGELVRRKVQGRTATTHWRAIEPMAPYLAFFAAGSFRVLKGRYDGRPWYAAVSRRVTGAAQKASMRMMRRSPVVTAWLEDQLGTYPFSTTGGLVTALPVGFALENQTRPTYPVTGPGSTWLVVHELAHQWFGDSVSVDTWRDIWLNEGFATFMEVAWEETHGGPSGVAWLANAYDDRVDDDRFWRLPIDDPGRRNMFDYRVYVRGAMAVQALRNRIGEDDFWRLLRTWVATHRDGNASVAQFQALAESVSGENLDGFFDAWLRAGTRPAPTAENGLSGG